MSESIGAVLNTAPIDLPVGSASPGRPTRDRLCTEHVGGASKNLEKKSGQG